MKKIFSFCKEAFNLFMLNKYVAADALISLLDITPFITKIETNEIGDYLQIGFRLRNCNVACTEKYETLNGQWKQN